MRIPHRMRRLFRQLETRGIFRVTGLYAAGSFVVLQVADLVLPALPLPEATYDAVVILTLLGFPIAVVVAWFFDLTDEGMRRSPSSLEAYEDAPPAAGKVRAASATAIVVLAVAAAGLLAFRTILRPPADADRVAFAAFPFTASSSEWREGVPDLLLTALDGAEPMRVLDPWALWTVLREEPGGPAEAPDPARAGRIASDHGAHDYLLGSVVELGDRVELVARLYRTGRAEPLESFRVGGPVSEMPALVDRLAIDIMNRVAGSDPTLSGLQRNATNSPEALKAYLAARAAMRRGQVDSAVTAIDRAVVLDSTFALAWLQSSQVYSWAQHMRGEFFAGLFERLDRAEAHGDSLTGRNRLRLRASRALVATRGDTAAAALNRILQLDSTDLQAWANLSYCHMVYGWQYGTGPEEAVRAMERVLALDSSYVPAWAGRAWLAVSMGDTAALRRVRSALERRGGESNVGRSTLEGLRALAVPDSALPALAERQARRGLTEWVTSYRYLRVDAPDRAELLTRGAADVPDPRVAGQVGAQRFRLQLARARLATVRAGMAGAGYGPALGMETDHRFLLAAALVGVGDSTMAGDAAAALSAALSPDSALARFETYPVWWTAWILGAYHAQMGDTARARVWQDVIGTLPAGGTPQDYRGALRSDIEARLLARRDDLAGATAAAERAYELWGIHTDNTYEAMPEPQMRFHLASLRAATGDDEAAAWLFRSLVPPSAWLGFLTARAHYELGSLAEAAGDLDDARHHYGRALALWAPAEPPAAQWRDQARAAYGRVIGEAE